MQLKWPMLWDLFSLFPAYAGVIPGHTETEGKSVTFPRIRGGDPALNSLSLVNAAFPRIRGGDPYWERSFFQRMRFSPHTRG